MPSVWLCLRSQRLVCTRIREVEGKIFRSAHRWMCAHACTYPKREWARGLEFVWEHERDWDCVCVFGICLWGVAATELACSKEILPQSVNGVLPACSRYLPTKASSADCTQENLWLAATTVWAALRKRGWKGSLNGGKGEISKYELDVRRWKEFCQTLELLLELSRTGGVCLFPFVKYPP